MRGDEYQARFHATTSWLQHLLRAAALRLMSHEHAAAALLLLRCARTYAARALAVAPAAEHTAGDISARLRMPAAEMIP